MQIYSFVTELFQTETVTGGRKRAFVPKHMKLGKDKDAKRRKIDKSNGNHHDAKKFNKSDDKNPKFNKQKGEKKFSGKTNVDKSSGSNPASKKLKKTKPKKAKGKKNRNRNK